MAEAENGTTMPFEAKVLSQFEKKKREANTDEKKRSIAQQILQSLKDAVAYAQQAKENDAQNATTTNPIEVQENKEKAAQPVLELFQLLSENTTAPNDAMLQELHLSEMQKTFFEGLASVPHTIESAPLLVSIINKVIADEKYLVLSVSGGVSTAFETDVREAKKNPRVKNAIIEGIRLLARDKKIKDVQGKVLHEDEVIQSLQLLEDREEKGVNPAEYKRKYDSYSARLTEGIQNENKSISSALQKIQSKRNAIEASNTSEEEKTRQIEQLRQEEIKLNDNRIEIRTRPNAIMDYLNHNEIQPPFKSETEIRNYLASQGFREDEIDEMKKIFPLMADTVLRGRALGQGIGYEVLGQTITNDYSRLALQSKIIKDGQIDMDALKEVQANIEDDIGVLFDTLYTSPKSDFQEAFNPYTEGQMLSNVIQYLRTEFSELAKNFAKQKISTGTPIDSKEFRDFKGMCIVFTLSLFLFLLLIRIFLIKRKKYIK